MQTREKVLGVITIASGAFFVITQFVCSGEKAAPPGKLAAAPKPAAAAGPAKTVASPVKGEKISDTALRERLQNWQPLVTYDTWGGNPFEGAVVPEADSSADSLGLRLSGIVRKGDSALALVGGQIMRPGDRAGPFELLKIFNDRVVGRQNGEMITLYLERDKKYEITSPH